MSVLVSLGRHEEYGPSLQMPISLPGAVKAWLSSALIEEKCGRPDIIMSSPVARAQATATLRSRAWGKIPLIIRDELEENADSVTTAAFKIELAEEAAAKRWQHVHLVTHAPTIARLNDGYAVPLNTGDILVWKAESWEDMAENIKKSSLIRSYKLAATAQFADLVRASAADKIDNIADLAEWLAPK